jgi:hypothetical protein
VEVVRCEQQRRSRRLRTTKTTVQRAVFKTVLTLEYKCELKRKLEWQNITALSSSGKSIIKAKLDACAARSKPRQSRITSRLARQTPAERHSLVTSDQNSRTCTQPDSRQGRVRHDCGRGSCNSRCRASYNIGTIQRPKTPRCYRQSDTSQHTTRAQSVGMESYMTEMRKQ